MTEQDYQSVSKTQDTLMQHIDACQEALLDLKQLIMKNQERNERQFAEIQAMLQAIIKDQNVPYKPTMGFMKDE